MTKDSLSSHSDHSDQSPKNNAATPATTTEPINAQTNNSSKPANSASLSTSSPVAPNARNQNPSHTTLRDDPSPTPAPASALPKPKPFADQFYEAVNEVLGGTNDQQFLMLTLPGQSLDPYTYAWDYKQGVKPTRVLMQEFLLSEKLFDPCTMSGGDNGFTLAHQYRSALDTLTTSIVRP